MQFLAVLQTLPDGRCRGTVPDIPEIIVEAPSSFEVERLLPGAIERFLDTVKAAPPRNATWCNVIAYTRKYADLRRPRREMGLPAMRRLVEIIDQLTAYPVPSDVLNSVIRFRYELRMEIRKHEPKPAAITNVFTAGAFTVLPAITPDGVGMVLRAVPPEEADSE